jgi:acetolactate synthase I/II/III large subunit
MGFGVAGVLGAKLAAPDRSCISVCGDGAFFMHAHVLGTAVEYAIPAVWVVWNNYLYASIRGLQRSYSAAANSRPIFAIPKWASRIIPISGTGTVLWYRRRKHRSRRRSRRRD